jgi:LysM repeat protein
MLRVWNRLKGDSLAGRRVLYLHLPVTPTRVETQVASNGSSRTANSLSKRKKHTSPQLAQGTVAQPAPTNVVLHHKVKAGETLYSIASSYNTSVTALKRDNRDVAILRPGMILVVRDVR